MYPDYLNTDGAWGSSFCGIVNNAGLFFVVFFNVLVIN